MSVGSLPDAGSDSSDSHEELVVEHNPAGPWANLKDENLQNAILRLAGKHHVSCAADNPKFAKFADFLDAFAAAWLVQKAQVEEEAQKYGFTPCTTTAEIPEEDRRKAALLSLTLNGSFVLLGNGCLTSHGGSGRYEKIPLRRGAGPTRMNAPYGVIVSEEAALNTPLRFSENGYPFIGHTSPLQALYFTKENLGSDDAIKLGKALSASVSGFSQTFRADIDESIRDVPFRKRHNQPDYLPEEHPEFEPV